MTSPLTYLRYGLILLPAAADIFLQQLDNYGEYMVYILLFLAITVLSRFLPSPAYLKAAALLEIPLSLWLCHQYGFMMVFLSISTLCVYLPLLQQPGRLCLALGHLLLLNMAITDYDALLLTTANLLFLFVAVTFNHIHEMHQKQVDHIQLYDELKRLHFQQDEAGRQLLQFAHQVESAAQAEERNRISRQLHDDIGHRLIRIKMMMEAALHIVPQDSGRGMDMLHQIRDQLGESMEQMRSAVKQMNPVRRITDDYSLDRLLEETGRETGIETDLILQGIPYPLYPSQQVVLYKNAREAITNAIRHGEAKRIQIILHYGDQDVRMEVSNDGTVQEPAGHEAAPDHQGIGMSSMLERTQVVGGTLEVRRTVPFTVITRLPVYQKREIM
ncbi:MULTISPECIES: sensor histidine kinase [Paenibacillus]|uniref:histidine kinase n=1 Tax=Paenibacillus lautus TaxID=1401 RepID=A0A1R1B0G7_PAELA|nr:histidine kinase [Paenibacillus lautus]OME91658.1 two-component sensor histidine kinase [Paenibacillus lautus]